MMAPNRTQSLSSTVPSSSTTRANCCLPILKLLAAMRFSLKCSSRAEIKEDFFTATERRVPNRMASMRTVPSPLAQVKVASTCASCTPKDGAIRHMNLHSHEATKKNTCRAINTQTLKLKNNPMSTHKTTHLLCWEQLAKWTIPSTKHFGQDQSRFLILIPVPKQASRTIHTDCSGVKSICPRCLPSSSSSISSFLFPSGGGGSLGGYVWYEASRNILALVSMRFPHQ